MSGSEPRNRGPSARTERTILAIAQRQFGFVTHAQLVEAGVARGSIYRRLKTTGLRRFHRGVYLVGPLAPTHARERAALLACGESAVVSHGSAAVIWELVRVRGSRVPVQVLVTDGKHPRHGPGIQVKRATALHRDEVTVRDGLRVTTPARTLYDLAGMLVRKAAPGDVTKRELERAVALALDRRITTRAELLSLLARHDKRPGTRTLRALLESDAEPALTQSEAEDRFLDLMGQAQLPTPENNVVVEGYRVDFYWRAERLAVEVDGYAFHSSRVSFERDRRRDTTLAAAGVRVVRVTWRQIVGEPVATASTIARVLGASKPA